MEAAVVAEAVERVRLLARPRTTTASRLPDVSAGERVGQRLVGRIDGHAEAREQKLGGDAGRPVGIAEADRLAGEVVQRFDVLRGDDLDRLRRERRDERNAFRPVGLVFDADRQRIERDDGEIGHVRPHDLGDSGRRGRTDDRAPLRALRRRAPRRTRGPCGSRRGRPGSARMAKGLSGVADGAAGAGGRGRRAATRGRRRALRPSGAARAGALRT